MPTDVVTAADWSFITAVLSAAGIIVMVFSATLIIRQIKIAAKAAQFEAMKQIGVLIRSINSNLYRIPTDVIYRHEEFPDTPPPRHQLWKPSKGEGETMEEAKRKRDKFFEPGGGHEQFSADAVNAINAINDIAQFIEDGYIGHADVLGQYHFKLIRIIHIVEPFRTRKKGDYGHRLLRLRQKAIAYHYMRPKHSDQNVSITDSDGTELLRLFNRLPQDRGAREIRRKYARVFRKRNT
jgi:hypothetical protein